MDSKEIFQEIVNMALKHGASPVRDACDKFIRSGIKSVSEPTKRRSIRREWVYDAFFSQRGRCKRCKEPMILDEATGDHCVPLTNGGAHEKRNIVAVHGRCNSSKNDNSLLEESRKTGNMIDEIFPDED